jgi:hypothetical protein
MKPRTRESMKGLYQRQKCSELLQLNEIVINASFNSLCFADIYDAHFLQADVRIVPLIAP